MMLLLSAVFVAGGAWLVVSGDSLGWFIAGFFSLGFFVAVLEPWLPKRHVNCAYRLFITKDEIACEYPKSERESIRWQDVSRIWYITTSDGPWLPDEWIWLEGEAGGCVFPTEATDFKVFWKEIEQRFPGFNYEPLVYGGTDDAKYLCWQR